MMQKFCRSILFLMVVLVFSSMGYAQSDDNQDEVSVRKAARLRLYPGGVDVEPLKVQDPLPLIKKDGDNEMTESVDAD